MRLIKIGLGNINSTVGAVDSNAEQVVEVARAMAAEAVTVALFPEQVIGGYQPEDLVQWQGFVERQWDALVSVAARTAELPMVLVVGVVIDHQGLHYNCAAVVAGGEIRALVPEGKAADLQHLLRAADDVARDAAGARRASRGAVRRSGGAVRFRACWGWRCAKTSGAPRGRCGGGPMRGRS